MKGKRRADAQEIISALKEGRKVENCPSSTLCYYRQRLGIKPDKRHPNREKIIAALQAKEKWTWIESEFKCTSSTISRYKKEMLTSSSPAHQ